MKTRKAKRSYWTAHIKAWNSSGLSQAEYCRINHLSSKSFTYWKRKVTELSSTTSLIPVHVLQNPRENVHPSNHLIIRFENQLAIEVPADFDPSTLTKVVEVLRRF